MFYAWTVGEGPADYAYLVPITARFFILKLFYICILMIKNIMKSDSAHAMFLWVFILHLVLRNDICKSDINAI